MDTVNIILTTAIMSVNIPCRAVLAEADITETVYIYIDIFESDEQVINSVSFPNCR